MPPSSFNSARSGADLANPIEPIPSAYWLLFPSICLLVVASAVISLSKIHISVAINWSDQTATFIAINKFLSILPASLWSNITQFGDATVLIPIVSLLLLTRRETWIPILYSTPIAGVICLILKRTFDAPRPSALLEPNSFIQIGELLAGHNSFPSGHTTTIFVVIVTILYANYPKANTLKQRFLIGFGIASAMLIGLSRIAIGAHWPLDVVLGASIGATSALIGVHLARKCHNKWAQVHLVKWLGCGIPGVMSILLMYRIYFDDQIGLVVIASAISGLVSSAIMFRIFSLELRRLDEARVKERECAYYL